MELLNGRLFLLNLESCIGVYQMKQTCDCFGRRIVEALVAGLRTGSVLYTESFNSEWSCFLVLAYKVYTDSDKVMCSGGTVIAQHVGPSTDQRSIYFVMDMGYFVTTIQKGLSFLYEWLYCYAQNADELMFLKGFTCLEKSYLVCFIHQFVAMINHIYFYFFNEAFGTFLRYTALTVLLKCYQRIT